MNRLARVHPLPWAVAIPPGRRHDTVLIFRAAASVSLTAAINSNNVLARPEEALVKAASDHRSGPRKVRLPQRWVQPVYRDVMGLGARELTEWENETHVMGRAMVLRAIAHGIENGDIP